TGGGTAPGTIRCPSVAASRTNVLDSHTFFAPVTSNTVGKLGARRSFINASAISASASAYGRMPRTRAHAPRLSAYGAVSPAYAVTRTHRGCSGERDASNYSTRTSVEKTALI